MILKLIGTAVGIALLGTSFAARAADMPTKTARATIPIYNWTGLYAGINAGYGSAQSDWSFPPANISASGLMYGLTVGYNFEVGSVVWGVEGDIALADIAGSVGCGGGTFSCELKSRWLATVRARLGYAIGRFLPYITAGAAGVGGIQANVVPAAATISTDKLGYAVGAGFEYAFLGNWSAKIEYLYVDPGKFDAGFLGSNGGADVTLKQSIFRAGLNYKFLGPMFGPS